MILLTAVFAGLLIGQIRARWIGAAWQAPALAYAGLVLIAFLPQLLVVYVPSTRAWFPDWAASALLLLTQVLFLAFCALNRRLPGMALLGLGVALNLLAMLANGGFMPIDVGTAARLLPPDKLAQIHVGARLGTGSKDILLATDGIALPWLADRFLPPD